METSKTQTTIEKSFENATERKETYWLNSTILENNPKHCATWKLFHQDDIQVGKITPNHLNKLIRRKLGNTSSKQNDVLILQKIQVEHDSIRHEFRTCFKKSFENLMVNAALIIGMRDGKSKYMYKDITEHVLEGPNFFTVCRMSYLMRGMFEKHHQWKLKLELKYMEMFKFKYQHEFKSTEKNFGCFSNIISEVITNKHRDINSRMMKRHQFRIVQRSTTHKNTVKGRLRQDNKSFFSILKNVQYINKDVEEIDDTMPEQLKFKKNKHNEVHYDILEDIVFEKGSLTNVYYLVGEWIGDISSEIKDKSDSKIEAEVQKGKGKEGGKIKSIKRKKLISIKDKKSRVRKM